MKLTGIHIKNFKAIHEMKIDSIENALILVGQNNTGKTTILEAIRASFGDYHISEEDFRERRRVRRCSAVYLYRTPGWLGALSGWGAQK